MEEVLRVGREGPHLPAYRNMGYGMLPGLEILPNFVPGLHHDVLHLWHRLGEALEALQMVFWRLLWSSSGGLGSPMLVIYGPQWLCMRARMWSVARGRGVEMVDWHHLPACPASALVPGVPSRHEP